MKQFSALLLCSLLLFTLALPASAAEKSETIYYSEEALDNGIIIISEIIEHTLTRSNTRNYEHTKTVIRNGTTIGVVSIYGSFLFDGNTVSVVSKSVTQSTAYDGWSYKQNTFSSSGGTISLTATFSKLLSVSIPLSMTLSCDANGNISYT